MSKDKIEKIKEIIETIDKKYTEDIGVFERDEITQAIQTQIIEPMEEKIKDSKVFLDDMIEHAGDLEKQLAEKDAEIKKLNIYIGHLEKEVYRK